MPKQILLYGGIYSDTAAQFLTELEANKDNEPVVRVNCPGGDPYSTFGMIAKACEIGACYQVDGRADSSAFYLVANAGMDCVECLDVTTFVAHRAMSWMEDYPDNYPNALTEVKAVNVHLRGIIEKNLPKFEEVMGVTLDKLFSMEGGTKGRIDVKINATQAKKMGLVGKVNKLTAKKKTEIKAFAEQYHIAAFSSEPSISAENNNDMELITTLAQLKAQYPTLAAEAKTEGVTEGRAAGITYERKRISAWNRYRLVDAKTADTGIASGAEVDMDVVAEMSVKMASPAYLEAMKKQNTTVQTGEAETEAKTKEQLDAEAMIAAADKDLFGEKK